MVATRRCRRARCRRARPRPDVLVDLTDARGALVARQLEHAGVRRQIGAAQTPIVNAFERPGRTQDAAGIRTQQRAQRATEWIGAGGAGGRVRRQRLAVAILDGPAPDSRDRGRRGLNGEARPPASSRRWRARRWHGWR
jgi:hypothetical protein